MRGVCLICEKQTEGIPIEEGPVIKAIRTIKGSLGIAKGNVLVICPGCWEEYRKRRTGFEKSMLIWSIIGVIFAALLIIPPILFGDWEIFNILRNIVLSIILIAVILALIGLVRYIPKTKMTLDEYRGKTARAPAKKTKRKTARRKTKRKR